MRSRKASSPSASGAGVSSSAAGGPHSRKRYLILTYTVEFDRVHYPLPLAFEDEPSAESMQRTIRRLRRDLAEQRSAAAGASDPRAEVSLLRPARALSSSHARERPSVSDGCWLATSATRLLALPLTSSCPHCDRARACPPPAPVH